ncbi:MAG TPA: hypothetical protein VFQ53_42755 [Kofleriaceae bacterium]|nr:hypothetical protein [Kofleriaceae bacterium]
MRALIVFVVLAHAARADAGPVRLAEISAGLEYSLFADVFREGGGTMAPAGPRVLVLATRGPLAIGGGVSTFASTDAAIVSTDLELGWRRDHERFGYRVGAGAGVLYTSDRTALPTYTDRHVGPTLHVDAALRYRASTHVVIESGLGLFLYPLQPGPGWSVGADARWQLAAGYCWH